MAFYPVMTAEEVRCITVSERDVDSQLSEVFREYGCALVTDVLTAEECRSMAAAWSRDLAGANFRPRDRLGPGGSGPFSSGYGIINGLLHGEMAWRARLHARIRRMFGILHRCPPEDLVTGIDVVFFSPENANGSAKENLQWLHVDQTNEDFNVQSVLYIMDSRSEWRSSTAVWPGSHHEVYRRLMRDSKATELSQQTSRVQSLQLNDCKETRIVDEAVTNTRRVPCPAGSLFLWDSKLIHQGWSGGPRLAQPICFEPRKWRDEPAFLRKLFACATGMSTTHSSREARMGWAFLAPVLTTAPYCIASGQEAAWLALQTDFKRVWADAKNGKDLQELSRHLKPYRAAMQALLRADVLDVL
jgi:hypothetical protein